eukprot:2212554-Amphidinium_carterae.2
MAHDVCETACHNEGLWLLEEPLFDAEEEDNWILRSTHEGKPARCASQELGMLAHLRKVRGKSRSEMRQRVAAI